MSDGWTVAFTAAHKNKTLPSGFLRKWDKMSGWMKDESMPDGRKVSFRAVYKKETLPSGWMRKCDKISDWMKYESIYREVKQVWLPNNEMQLKNNRYVELVLLPEVFLALYQKFFYLPAIEIAESRIKDPGSLASEDISPESSMNE